MPKLTSSGAPPQSPLGVLTAHPRPLSGVGGDLLSPKYPTPALDLSGFGPCTLLERACLLMGTVLTTGIWGGQMSDSLGATLPASKHEK